MYIHMHSYVHTRMPTCLHAYIPAWGIHAYIHTSLHACVHHSCMNVYGNIHIHVYPYSCRHQHRRRYLWPCRRTLAGRVHQAFVSELVPSQASAADAWQLLKLALSDVNPWCPVFEPPYLRAEAYPVSAIALCSSRHMWICWLCHCGFGTAASATMPEPWCVPGSSRAMFKESVRMTRGSAEEFLHIRFYSCQFVIGLKAGVVAHVFQRNACHSRRPVHFFRP